MFLHPRRYLAERFDGIVCSVVQRGAFGLGRRDEFHAIAGADEHGFTHVRLHHDLFEGVLDLILRESDLLSHLDGRRTVAQSNDDDHPAPPPPARAT